MKSDNLPATKGDLKNFATKDDIKNMATKDDLKNFATKDDLKKFATKDDLRKFATKDDLAKFATKDDLRRYATREDIEDVRDDLKTTVTQFKSDIVDLVDTVLGEIKSMREEQDVHAFAHDRVNNELLDHEQRIHNLESPSK